MRSSRKQKKHGQSHQYNDIVISDDIETTESYAGVGDSNVINNNINNINDSISSINTNFSLKKRNLKPQKSHLETVIDNKPVTNTAVKVKSACKSARKKKTIEESDTNVLEKLPPLPPKCGMMDQDQVGEVSSSINSQIEKLEYRKSKSSVAERKNEMKKILDRGRQNWSKFKSEIDFIKLVESSQSNQTSETENMIKNEKLLNVILNEIAISEKENIDEKLLGDFDITEEVNVQNDKNEFPEKENLENENENFEFQAVIKPMAKEYRNMKLSDDIAMSLKQMLFNSTSRSWGSEWYRQNIAFHPIDSDIPFGLIQKNEGPNNILAIVQAEFLVEALFRCDINRNWIQNIKRNRNHQLANALSKIISRCKSVGSNSFQLCLLDINLKGRTIGLVKSDGITECLVLFEIFEKAELQKMILQNISQFTDLHSPGLILLIVSCIMTHGITNCQTILSNKTRLINPFGFANDELMNFLMHGSFNSHYFNNKIEIIDPDTEKSTFIHGIPRRTSIGFLTTETHCEYCLEIGTYLKTPKYPVWIAKWKNNIYCVLYCHNRTLLSDWKTEIRFKLHLYSATFKNQKSVSMIIDSSQSELENLKLLKQEKDRKIELEKHAQSLTEIRLKGMSETSRKFLLEDCSIEDYMGGDALLSVDDKDLNELDKIIHIKWPNAIISVDDDGHRVLSNLLKH